MTHHIAAFADCVTCGRDVDAELAICTLCLDAAQQTIRDTQTAFQAVPDNIRDIIGLRAIRYDKPTPRPHDDGDLPHGLNVIYDGHEGEHPIRGIRQPETAMDLLHNWAQDWADRRGDTIGNVFDYLVSTTRWAAQHLDHEDWHTYLTETRQIRTVMRRIAGISPEHQPVPCTRCGGQVIQDWTDTGLDDTLQCTTCGTTWPGLGRFALEAAHDLHNLPHTAPDTLVTTDEARRILPNLKRNTLNQALKRDRGREGPRRLPQHGTTTDGHPLYRLGDIVELASTTTEGTAA